MEWVVVGDAGNPDDDEVMTCCFELTGTTGFGGVPYVYRIGKFEVTNTEYVELLNAVAASDPNGLWTFRMALDKGGILRSGSDGSYIYSVKPGWENRPVNFIDFFRSARFANWLHNGQPVGAQDATTTEDGAYTLLGSNPLGVQRNPGATVFIPNEDEWYKAAYYDPYAQVYYDYPLGSDALPNADPPPGNGNTCNYVEPSRSCPDVYLGICDLTDVGAYSLASSPFGTFDQCSNTIELMETRAVAPAQIIVRGSAWAFNAFDAKASFRNDGPMECESCWGVGFRVAGVVPGPLPECTDGLDNDGDGLVDASQDLGCDDFGDGDEHSPILPCDDGLDNDGDGLADYDPDPGEGDAACTSPDVLQEDPPCQDGVNNDPAQDSLIDFDGGASAGLPPAQQTSPDPECQGDPWRGEGSNPRCGLGAELLLLLPLGALRARIRRPGAPPAR